jgi:tetratricopeptide (TPR) repeat protein
MYRMRRQSSPEADPRHNSRNLGSSPTRANLYFAVTILVILVGAVFYPVAQFGFVNWDDYAYVVHNGHVTDGLSWSNVQWAFMTTYNASYLPLTWLSHMLDSQLFGMWAGGHHLVSVLWHTLNTLVLFGFLDAATNSRGRSFWVAALFAVHPLHVESVAWISERKDVLATFFWFSGLWAYVRYVRIPSAARYLAVVGALLLGLLSKPMLVTFPFVLLLLDYWPLSRLSNSGMDPSAPSARQKLQKLVIEKIPMFCPIPIFAATTLFSQQSAHAITTSDQLPFLPRLANGIIAIAQYLWHLPLPVNLAAIYPHPARRIEWVAVAASAALTATLTLGALNWGKRRPYLLVGWFWFLGTLVPVLGLVQVGGQAWADRYTYVPYVGLFIVIVWLVADSIEARPRLRGPVIAGATVAVLAMAILAHAQVFTWENDQSLFGRVVDRFPNSFQGHFHLGDYYRTHGQWSDAVSSYRKAIDAAPERFDGWTNLGLALQGTGRTDAALEALQKACRLNPDSAAAAVNLAQMNESIGRVNEAEMGYRRALAINPNQEQSLFRLGTILAERGNLEESRVLVQQLTSLFFGGWTAGVTAGELAQLCLKVELWREAEAVCEALLRKEPLDAAAWSWLGLARQRQHRFGPAVDAYEEAIRLEPRMARARFNLGVAFIQSGDLARASVTYRDLESLDPEAAAKLLGLIRQQEARSAHSSISPGP